MSRGKSFSLRVPGEPLLHGAAIAVVVTGSGGGGSGVSGRGNKDNLGGEGGEGGC